MKSSVSVRAKVSFSSWTETSHHTHIVIRNLRVRRSHLFRRSSAPSRSFAAICIQLSIVRTMP